MDLAGGEVLDQLDAGDAIEPLADALEAGEIREMPELAEAGPVPGPGVLDLRAQDVHPQLAAELALRHQREERAGEATDVEDRSTLAGRKAVPYPLELGEMP